LKETDIERKGNIIKASQKKDFITEQKEREITIKLSMQRKRKMTIEQRRTEHSKKDKEKLNRR
jgi:hypothetical protein